MAFFSPPFVSNRAITATPHTVFKQRWYVERPLLPVAWGFYSRGGINRACQCILSLGSPGREQTDKADIDLPSNRWQAHSQAMRKKTVTLMSGPWPVTCRTACHETGFPSLPPLTDGFHQSAQIALLFDCVSIFRFFLCALLLHCVPNSDYRLRVWCFQVRW